MRRDVRHAEFFRRAHGLESGIRAAMAAYVGGAAATSNVEAGRRYAIPIAGTMAHSFVQAFDSELAAFREFARDHADGTTLLVDTYDTLRGVARAIEVIRELRPHGVRVRALRQLVFRNGSPERDVLELRDQSAPGVPLLRPIWRAGERLVRFDLARARERVAHGLANLPASWRTLEGPEVPPEPRIGPKLAAAAAELKQRLRTEQQ